MVPGSNPGGPTSFMQSNKIAFSLILLLSVFAIYCSLIIGISWDEHFAQIHALAKIDYVYELYNITDIVLFSVLD